MNDTSHYRIVNKIADITGARDIVLIEVSLLKTIDELFKPEWAAVYKFENPKDVPASGKFSSAMRNGELVREPFAGSFDALIELDDVVAVPIMSRTRTLLGYLAVKRKNGLDDAEQKLAVEVLRIYDNYLAVLREAQMDQLTGLLNRHTFDTQLEHALDLARKECRPVLNPAQPGREQTTRMFFGEIDIDHFKKINDNFGHLHGDEVLMRVARMMQESFRECDLVYRFGGEEFVVIVLSEDGEGATQSFERLRRKIETCNFPQVGRVTISIGVTEIRGLAAPVQLLGHADQALYYAKEHGRNQVCFYEELIQNGGLVVHETAGDVELF